MNDISYICLSLSLTLILYPLTYNPNLSLSLTFIKKLQFFLTSPGTMPYSSLKHLLK